MKNNVFRKLYVFFKRKHRVIFKKKYRQLDIDLLKDKNFVIVSDNCWGAEIYKWLNRPYNTPFIGLGINTEHYLKLLTNFEHYMSLEITFDDINNEFKTFKYPIGKLDDIIIHFTHYKNEEEALEKWDRRKKRMLKEKNKNNYIFKMCDGRPANKEDYIYFNSLPFKNKISFSIKDYSDLKLKNHFQIYERDKKNKKAIPNGVKLFKITFIYFHLFKWMKSNLAN